MNLAERRASFFSKKHWWDTGNATTGGVRKKKKSPEHDIQTAIFQYLSLKKIFCWRNNTGAIKTQHGFLRFGAVGSPDIFAVREGKIYGIEVKSEAGKLSPGQQDWGERFSSSGGVYIVARSIDDVAKSL